MTPLLYSVLLIFLKEVSSCRVESFVENQPYDYNKYGVQYDRYSRLITSKNVTVNSTIICSNLYSLGQMSYSYVAQEYEQFLVITESNISAIYPTQLSSFSTITKLYLSQLHIIDISPGSFTSLTRLRELYLNDNELSQLSNGVYNNLHRLEILNLTNNKIQQIENRALIGVSSLIQLHLRNNNISALDNNMFEMLNHLEFIDISQNPLEEFPFMSNSSIKVFNLSSCQISTANFSYFPKTEELDLSNNKIDTVEDCQLLDTFSVNLDNNQITTIGNFRDLSHLSLAHNK
jgi:Leucine-rich repeat (LRR) protein